MIKRNFLSKDDRARLTGIARDGLEEHRVARRANAILLLDKGWSCDQVSEALLLDDDTIRSWFKVYREGGVTALARFDLAGGHRSLAAERLTALKAWATETRPTSTRAIGHHIRTMFGVSYTRSGLIKLMAALDFVWRKPDLVPSHPDLAAQRDFIEQHDNRRTASRPTRRSSTAMPSTRPIRRDPRARGCRVAPTSRSLRLLAVIG